MHFIFGIEHFFLPSQKGPKSVSDAEQLIYFEAFFVKVLRSRNFHLPDITHEHKEFRETLTSLEIFSLTGEGVSK